MKRILIVTPRYTFPVVGGDRLRIFQIAKALAREFSVDLLSLTASRHAPVAPPAGADNPFHQIDQIYLPRWRSVLNCLLALPAQRSLQLAYFWSDEMAREVARRTPDYDAVLFHLARSAQYRSADTRTPAVVELTDAISLNYQRIQTTHGVPGLRAAIFALEQPRIGHYERRLLSTLDTCVLVSRVDRDYLLQGLAPDATHSILVCPNGIDLAQYPFQQHQPDSRTLAFVGNLESLQNLDAVHWFAREVLPLLRDHDAGFKLKVIGRIRTADRARLSRIQGVEVTGEVASIAAQLSGCLCGVCPVRIGAGIQNKILEYMACGLPAIVSPVGLEGLLATPGENVLVADGPQAYVKAILELRSNTRPGHALALAGRSYVEQHHNWQHNLQPLVDRFKALTR